MRFAMLGIVLLVGCGGAEPISAGRSAVGCWNSLSSHQELDLSADGTMRWLNGDTAMISTGTWTESADAIDLAPTGAPTQRLLIQSITPSEMWTDGGTVTHWQAVACQ